MKAIILIVILFGCDRETRQREKYIYDVYQHGVKINSVCDQKYFNSIGDSFVDENVYYKFTGKSCIE